VPGTEPEPVIGALEAVWHSTASACEGLRPEEWELPTDCPGWTVRDQISHLIGIERTLLGDAPPAPADPAPRHVKNDFGRVNEAWVAARRAVPGDEVLAEFAAVTERRLEALRAMPPERFDEVGWSPVGQVPYRQFMDVRVFDSWVHEQDVRRALGRPGGRGGPGEAVTLDRVASIMPFVVGRNVRPPEGTTVVWSLSGGAPREVAVEVAGGRGRVAASVPPEPTARLAMDSEVFWRLGCGRLAAADALDAGDVVISGDVDLGRRVLESMNFMF
jgi:uncharacterized protein (TIGR03083 family)